MVCCIPIRKKAEEKGEPPEKETSTHPSFLPQPNPTKAVTTERKLLEKISLLPDRVNWVEEGVIGPVVDQQNSAACWAFQTVNELNAMFTLATGKSHQFSVQELIDYDAGQSISRYRAIAKRILRMNDDYSGDLSDSLIWVCNYGLSLEKDYPFTGGFPKIPPLFKRAKRKAIKINNMARVPYFREDYLKLVVAHHPVMVALYIEPNDFAFNYKRGIYMPPQFEEDELQPHGALLVGYDVIEGKKVWNIQNCWGKDWGMDGYMYLLRDVDHPSQNCYVAQRPVFPIISSFNNDPFDELDFDWVGLAPPVFGES